MSKDMQLRLAVYLPPGWADVSHDNPGGPLTLSRPESEGGGVVQISIHAEYCGGEIPNPGPAQLITAAERIAVENDCVEIRGRASGQCALGSYGSVLASLEEFSWFEVSMISNGKDFVLASYICSDEPSEEEANEASWIVKNVGLKRA